MYFGVWQKLHGLESSPHVQGFLKSVNLRFFGQSTSQVKLVYSIHGVPIRLPEERWLHIKDRHPEIRGQLDKVLETVSDPDLIQEEDTGEFIAVRFYADTPLTSKYLVVMYREISSEDGFISTAYLCNQFSKRRTILWRR